MSSRGLNFSGSGYGPEVDSCEQVIEPVIEVGSFFDLLNDRSLHRKDCTA